MPYVLRVFADTVRLFGPFHSAAEASAQGETYRQQYRCDIIPDTQPVDALYNPQWGVTVQVEAAFYAMMTGDGFEPCHTGGGCMAWSKPLSDNEYLLLTNDEVSLDGGEGCWQRGDPAWTIGRYLDTDSDSFWYSVSGATVAQALEIAGKLPVPTGDDCLSLEQFVPWDYAQYCADDRDMGCEPLPESDWRRLNAEADASLNGGNA